MKILMTNNRIDQFGGSEMFVHDLSKALVKLGNEVHVIAYEEFNEDNPLIQSIQKNGVKLLSSTEDLDKDYDIIHCHHSNITGEINYHLPDIPKIFVSHGITFGICIPNDDIEFKKIIGVSEEVKYNLENMEFGYKDIQVINNPIDTDRFKYIDKNFMDKPKNVCAASNHFGKPCKKMGINCREYEIYKEKYFLEYCFSKCLKKPSQNIFKFSEYIKGLLYNVGSCMFVSEEGKIDVKNHAIWDVENAYKTADIVFAIGRSALISILMGIPTVIYDHYGYGDLIETIDDIKRLRKTNLSGRKEPENRQLKIGEYPVLKPYKLLNKWKKITKNKSQLKDLSNYIKDNYGYINIAKKYMEVYKSAI